MNRIPILRLRGFPCIYTRLQAVSWTTENLTTPSTLVANAGVALAALLSTAELPLVVNCIGVNSIDDHSIDELRTQLQDAQTKNSLVLFESNVNFSQNLREQLGEPAHSFQESGATVHVYGIKPPNRDETEGWIRICRETEHTFVLKKVNDCFRPNDGGKMTRLTSTPFLSNGIFNARQLITDRDAFVWITLRLSDQIRQWVVANPNSDLRLLAVSLRASPFAAAVNIFSRDLRVEIVDHLGPKYQVLEEYRIGERLTHTNYLYVADFIIGGTELKIAENYARIRGSRIVACFSIGALLEDSAYSDTIAIRRLVALTDPKLMNKARYLVFPDAENYP